MKGLDQYLVPYIIVQAIALIFLITALRSTRAARILFSALFIYAAIFNMQLSLRNPDAYLDYARLALPFYRDFINGWFSHYHHFIIPLIATGQFLIGLGMLLKSWWVKWACIGAIIFLLCITPLMVGSGFPFPILTSLAAFIILKKSNRDYVWKKIQTFQPLAD